MAPLALLLMAGMIVGDQQALAERLRGRSPPRSGFCPQPSLPLPPSSCSNALTQPSNWPAQVRVCSNTAACQQAGQNPAGPFIQPQSVHYNGVNYSASYRFTLSPASLSDQAATLRS